MFIRQYQWFIWGLLGAVITVAAKGILMAPQDLATLTSSTFAGHEWQYNIYRLMAMGDALSEGMPGRWIENFSFGWGYPLFQYTGPIPYSLGAILVNIGFEPIAALNASWLAAYIGAGVAMFWSTRPIFGRWGALLATACYLLAPYHLVDTYVRTNLVETAAFIFPPLILRALWMSHEQPRHAIVLGAIAVMMLPLTHMLSTYLIGLGLGIFSLTYFLLLPSHSRFPMLRVAMLLALFGLALSAFFWWPALIDIDQVRGMGAITEGFYSYQKHFVYPQQLISSAWHYGGSEEGPNDYMSFSLGQITLAVSVFTFLLTVIALLKNAVIKTAPVNDITSVSHQDKRVLAFVFAAFVAALSMTYMTLAASDWLWGLLPGVDGVQFPWRFLFPASFFLAVCAGALPKIFMLLLPRIKWLMPILAGALTLAVISGHWDFARAGMYDSIEHSDLTDTHHKKVGVWTTNNFEFMPAAVGGIPYAGTTPSKPLQFYQDGAFPEERIASVVMGHGWATIQLLPGPAGELEFRQHWHPAWQASVDGVEVETYPHAVHPFAPIRINVPENTFEVSFRYGYTTAGQLGLIASLTALLLGLFLLMRAGQGSLLRKLRFPSVAFLALLAFYFNAASPETRTSDERLADIPLRISLEEISVPKAAGTRWDASGNQIMTEEGLLIELDSVSNAPALELSLDHNDRYFIGFMLDGNLLDRVYTQVDNRHGGVAVHRLAVPKTITAYDTIAVIPLAGDGYYSLGHLSLLNEPVSEPVAALIVHSNSVHKLSEVSVYRGDATLWNAPGNIIFDMNGTHFEFDEMSQARRLDISVDSNDVYSVYFFHNDKIIANLSLPEPNPRPDGLVARQFEVPVSAYQQGYNRIAVVPVYGDSFYSIGHLILR